MCIAAGIIGAGALGATGSIIGGQEQAGASENATNAQQNMFNEQIGNLAPFREGGGEALSSLNYLLGEGPNKPGLGGQAGGYGSLNAPFTASMMKQYSPAYQFQLQQGQQGVLNQDAGAQGSLSGASLKDLTSFNQNYANTAFNNAFNQYQTQQQNVYGRLAGVANIGEAAASNAATGGSSYAQGIGQSLTNTGTALGASAVGASSALGSSGSNLALLNYLGGGGGNLATSDALTGLQQQNAAASGYSLP
jgi:hypothetical protein